MSLHQEISFEQEICDHLAAHGWLYADGDAQRYDRVRAIFPEDLLAWVQETQPKAWEIISKNHGSHAAETVIGRVRDQINQRGTLDVIRHGFELLGLKNKLSLAQFKPALGMNAEIIARYQANRLRVVRQVRYSLHDESSIDLTLFLNGIAVATVELKTDFTQSVRDAIDQYRFDRNSRPKGKAPEPLLAFPGGALVHFAVSNTQVAMTTKLEGPATQFLPFNLGNDGAAGNPPNPKGHDTAYLWERVWEREGWLEILGRYLVTKRDEKKRITQYIFPRYHQLDVTRQLLASVAKEGPGQCYLIQHSAGSGKTNSIAWSAHFLADLHDAEHKKIFDTVLVISDRHVIDTQLQEAIFDFERTTGVVAVIKGEAGSKSTELSEALAAGKKIVVCTIQTFPFALKQVRELASTAGKRFAVIADEAHSSQAGEAAIKLTEVLSAEEIKRITEEGEEISTEDVLASLMAAKAADGGISWVAFTATPKNKTLELFGRRPRPDHPASKENLPAPFHVYSMRQAIEEGFILNVLLNYISYKLAFKLAHDGKEFDEKEVEHGQALKGVMGWVRLHPYNISQKVEVVVEHFREFVLPLLSGQAKAMVVTGSRVEAVRWQIAIDKYIKSRGYKIRTLVAFSGDVTDKETGPDPFTENSISLNPTLHGRDIRKAFATDAFQILLVANKFQTGFDQPLLCGMYVDKRLAGIQAVQTLSRLNRSYPGKDTTYVLDFLNDPTEVLEAFKAYYTTAELANVTDPYLILNLREKLDSAGHYDDFEVNRVADAELNPKSKQSDLFAAVAPIANRLMTRYKAAQEALKSAVARNVADEIKKAKEAMEMLLLFRSDMATYVRLYTFLSQIFDYQNTDLEKRSIFFKRLVSLLDFGRERDGLDLSKVKLTHHILRNTGNQSMVLRGEIPKLKPITDAGGGSVQEKEKAFLSEIIEKVNDLFVGDVTDQDKLVYVNNVIKGKLLESETLKQQAANNTKEQFANSPDLKNAIVEAIMGALDAHTKMSTHALGSNSVQAGLKDVLLGPGQLYETLKLQTGDFTE